MKYRYAHIIVFTTLFFLAFFSCKKLEVEREMLVVTGEATEITPTSATMGGVIEDMGDGITQYGHCWSTEQNPSVDDFSSHLGSVDQCKAFTSLLQDLIPETRYYVRSYVSHGDEVVYGDVQSFTTLKQGMAFLNNCLIKNITSTSANFISELVSMGAGVDTVLQHGHCWSTEENPILGDSISELGSVLSAGDFTSNASGLIRGTKYYVRAYAINVVGVTYGDQYSFNTLAEKPTLTTCDITHNNYSSVASGGVITDDGGTEIFERGVCWAVYPHPTIDNDYVESISGNNEYQCLITGLEPSTKYFLRAYARNSIGLTYGNEIEFTTLPPNIPSINTMLESQPSEIFNKVYVSGCISDAGGREITEKGFCWSSSESPTTDNNILIASNGVNEFECLLTGLKCDSTYYVRAYAINEVGTGYGNNIKITPTRLYDYEGNSYRWVELGGKIWMADNLRTVHYSDGTLLEEGRGKAEISGDDSTKYYFYFEDNPAYVDTVGVLYTWTAALNDETPSNENPSGVQGVCPTGWHLPSDTEYEELRVLYGGYEYAGGPLKEAGYEYWMEPNEGATNVSGFSSKGSGYRWINEFQEYRVSAWYWTSSFIVESTQYSMAWGIYLRNSNSRFETIARYTILGFSVRCAKD